MADKKYVKWKFNKKVFDNWWSIMKVSFRLEDLSTFVNEKWYVNIIIAEKKKQDDFGTHYAYLDEWKPWDTKKSISDSNIAVWNELPF